MDDEWRALVNTEDCYINQLGDVTYNGRLLEPYKRDKSGRFRWVDLLVKTNRYDYELRDWSVGESPSLVWQLMQSAWFSNWPSDSELMFVDDNPWNCSVDNIRAWDRSQQRMIDVRDDGYYLTFDRRLRGRVEVIEMNRTFAGPSEAAKAVGGSRSGVSQVLSGRIATHAGFHFRWV